MATLWQIDTAQEGYRKPHKKWFFKDAIKKTSDNFSETNKVASSSPEEDLQNDKIKSSILIISRGPVVGGASYFARKRYAMTMNASQHT